MKKLYCAGKFCLSADTSLPLAKRLTEDYRSILLNDAHRLVTPSQHPVLNGTCRYIGPFYCEQASEGVYTSTDCHIVLEEERRAVAECDIYIAVFGEDFSVGTVVELGWALDAQKEILILYQKQESAYTICSEYWFAIADATARGNHVTVIPCDHPSQIVPLICNALEKTL